MINPLSTVLGFAEAVEDELARDTCLPSLRLTAERLRAVSLLLSSSLAGLMGDTLALSEVAARSYWHRNGFAKIVLHNAYGCAVRLHVWRGTEHRTGDVNPHGHRWDFASWVIVGTLRETRFIEDDSTCGMVYCRCKYDRDENGVGHLRPEGAFTLRKIEQTLRPTGAVYECPTTVVHTVEPLGSELIATVVVQGPAISRSTPVYLVPGTPPDNDQLTLSIEELRDVLGDVAAALR